MRVDELERELRAERPEPSLDFARRLDEWAESGFPRDRGLGPRMASRAGFVRRAWDRLSSTPPRRILLPAGAVATLVVVAGVAISRQDATDTGLTSRGPQGDQFAKPAPPERAPSAPDTATTQAEGAAGADAQSSSAGAEAQVAPDVSPSELELSIPPGGGGGGIARGTDQRIVDATARITLGAGADEVQDVADQVVAVTDRYHGVVLDSQVTSDQAGARASFQLEIPYARLDAALGDLSGLADVISRTEGGHDITARAVRARKDLAHSLDQIRQARIELIRADTREQKLVIKSQIASLEATADAQRTQLNGVKRQGRFASVSVDVTSNGPAAADDGNWGLDDAVRDAGDVLETIGGIALVSLAILLPLSLIAALMAFAVSRGRRRSREKALGD
ncbi:MAG: hypothetical protein QOI10_2904 [Solirubrobacterales bacterium]|jgi:hypothetical protein|nr:hypothetical protein [Solirubrobacterales bacterium]